MDEQVYGSDLSKSSDDLHKGEAKNFKNFLSKWRTTKDDPDVAAWNATGPTEKDWVCPKKFATDFLFRNFLNTEPQRAKGNGIPTVPGGGGVNFIFLLRFQCL